MDLDVIEHIEYNSYIKSFSDWVQSRYRKEFLILEEETSKLKWHLSEAEKIKEKIRAIKAGDKESIVSKTAFKWIQTRGVVRVKKTTIEGVLRYFNNKFHEKLSLRQFKLLLREAENEKMG